MTGEEFKDAILDLIDSKTTKVWLTQVNGHRMDFICSVGSAQLNPVQTVMRDGEFILMGQDVPSDRQPELKKLFDQFVETQELSEYLPLF